MDGILIGYARCSTAGQDLRAQRTALKRLGVPNDRIYTDKGYTGRNRHRPGLREALAACREGGTLVVAKLDRLGRSAVDLRAIADELEAKGTRLNIGGSVHDPTDPTGKLLSKGQNVSLPGDVQQIDVVLGWAESGVEVDASALLLNTGGKVRSDSDFVFYNQPESADGSVRFLGVSATEEGAQARIAIDLAVVPTDVHSVALVGSVDAGAFGDLGKLALRVVDGAGHTLAEHVTADATTESAFVFGEVYRRNDQWKVRAVGQGWASGLVGLATDFGVDIDDAPDSDVTMSVAEQPTAAATSPEDAAPLSEPSQPAAATKEKARGVRTAKRAVKKSKPIEFTLAENDAWQRRGCSRLRVSAPVRSRNDARRRHWWRLRRPYGPSRGRCAPGWAPGRGIRRLCRGAVRAR